MKKIIVPDASVILKWAFASPDEEDRDKALELLNDWLSENIEIILPKLWVFEVGNILFLKNPDKAMDIMEIFIDYNFTEVDITPELCKETFNLMKKYTVTFYDGVYHALAIIKDGIFITSDEKYCRKIVDRKHILNLNNW